MAKKSVDQLETHGTSWRLGGWVVRWYPPEHILSLEYVSVVIHQSSSHVGDMVESWQYSTSDVYRFFDFNSRQKKKRHDFERHLLLQHPKPFLLDLFFGASKQNRCIDAMMSSSRHDQMPFICWKCRLYGNSTWAILYSPLVLWLQFQYCPKKTTKRWLQTFGASNRNPDVLFGTFSAQIRGQSLPTYNWCRISFHQLYSSVEGWSRISYAGMMFEVIFCGTEKQTRTAACTCRCRLLPGIFFEQNHVRGFWIWNIMGALVIACKLIA